MNIIENFKRNSLYINDLIITYFEKLLKHKNNEFNFLIFFDIKYFLIFKGIINDQECYTNPKYYWICNFFENIILCFFKLWNFNNFLPIELFFTKDINKNISSLINEEYFLSIFANYNEGNDHYILNEIEKGLNITDIFINLNDKKRLEDLNWSSDDIDNLKIYFNQFKHMNNYLAFLSEVLNKSIQTIKRQLLSLNYIDKKGNVIYDEHYLVSSSSSDKDEISSVESFILNNDNIKQKEDINEKDETKENDEINEEKFYLKQKIKQPLLYTIYKLKKLNEKQKDSLNLTTDEISCNVDTVFEEMNLTLKSLYDLKKLSKNKFLSEKALTFDIPLSISSDLLEHTQFKKLLKLLEFVYNENSDEWVLKDNLDIDVFQKVVNRFEKLHNLTLEELRNELYDIKTKKSKQEEYENEEYEKKEYEKEDYEKKEYEKHLKENKYNLEDEELYMLPFIKLKGTFKLVKMMYQFIESNDEEFRIFFCNLINIIEDKCKHIFDKHNEMKDVELKEIIENYYKILLNDDQKKQIKSCYNKNEFENVLEIVGVFISKSFDLIITKNINEQQFLERCKIINTHKTIAVQDLKNIIATKEQEIIEKKKFMKEKKPTQYQKYEFIKYLCQYLYHKYYILNFSNENFNLFKEKYFGDDKILTHLYEKINLWNNKRDKKIKTDNLLINVENLIYLFNMEHDFQNETTNTTNIENENLNNVTIRNDNSLISFIKNICISLKGEDNNEIEEGEEKKEIDENTIIWINNHIHKDWLKDMLRVFYNILFDSNYNTLGKIFDEYKNIKEIVGDKTEDFLDLKKKKNVIEKKVLETNEVNEKKKEKIEETNINDNIFDDITTASFEKSNEIKSNISFNNEQNIIDNKIEENNTLNNKRKMDILIGSHINSFKKRKLENIYKNIYKKNRKNIIDFILKNKNIIHFKEADIISKVKQVFIIAKNMANNGELKNRWINKNYVKNVLHIQ